MCQFIIDSAASYGLQRLEPITNHKFQPQRRRANLLLFSANHPESLKSIAGNVESYCKSNQDRLDDVAYTLAKRREHLKLRSYCVVKDHTAPFVVSPQTKFQGPRQVAFVFTGQGAQW